MLLSYAACTVFSSYEPDHERLHAVRHKNTIMNGMISSNIILVSVAIYRRLKHTDQEPWVKTGSQMTIPGSHNCHHSTIHQISHNNYYYMHARTN